MPNCPACGAASISPRRVLMPGFGSVITCPACKAALRNTSRQSINCSVAMGLALGPVAHLTEDWPGLMVALLTWVVALGCYGYLRLARLEPVRVELDPQKWTARKSLRQGVGR